MGLAELKAKIASDADDKINMINAEAVERISGLTSEIKSSATGKVAEIMRRGESRAELEGKKIVSAAKVEASSTASAEKNSLIEEVFAEARKQILALSDKEKSRVLSKLASEASVIEGTVTAHVDAKYAKLFPKTKGVEVEATSIGDFGVILSSKDGGVEVDNTLTAVLSRIKERTKPEVAKTLFGGGK